MRRWWKIAVTLAMLAGCARPTMVARGQEDLVPPSPSSRAATTVDPDCAPEHEPVNMEWMALSPEMCPAHARMHAMNDSPATWEAARPAVVSAPGRAPLAGLPEMPSRRDVGAALRAVEEAVRACGYGGRSVTMIAVFGSDGQVTRAFALGRYAATPAAVCAADALRRATLPPFGRESFSVAYPFRLRQP
jgi:hypothetical protein